MNDVPEVPAHYCVASSNGRNGNMRGVNQSASTHYSGQNIGFGQRFGILCQIHKFGLRRHLPIQFKDIWRSVFKFRYYNA